MDMYVPVPQTLSNSGTTCSFSSTKRIRYDAISGSVSDSVRIPAQYDDSDAQVSQRNRMIQYSHRPRHYSRYVPTS